MGGSSVIVLDTHVLIWWIGLPGKISSKAKKAIQEATERKEILISSISVWEICLLAKRGHLKLTMNVEDWLRQIENLSFLRFVPVDNTIAIRAVSLPDMLHNDPADRIIIATTLKEGARLITADKRILQYPHVKTIW